MLLTVTSSILMELTFALVNLPRVADALPDLLRVVIPPFAGGALFPYLVIRLFYRQELASFGARWVTPGHRAGPWLIGSVVLVMATWTALWIAIYAGISLVPPDHPFADVNAVNAENPLYRLLVLKKSSSWILVLHWCVLVGFAEELFGRGLLWNALERRYPGRIGGPRFGIGHATLLCGLLFAIWHIRWLTGSWSDLASSVATNLTIVLVPSLLLALVYERTRSMLAVIVLHDVIDGGKLVAWYGVGRWWEG
ncbi:MAG: CPBP family intramembrane metalloprotease [Deltaproteobacteria bacterium]|nr:CPBP family intramembrane metalloprotease [Deltaproteobacteria bacterium]